MRRSAFIALALLLVACDKNPEPVVPPVVSQDVVFQVQTLPGFGPPGSGFRLPRVTVYGSGLLVDGLSSPPTQRQLTAEGVRKVVLAAAEAGLTKTTDFGTPGIADAPATRITAVFGTNTQSTSIVALDISDADGLTSAQRSQRAAVRELLARFGNLDQWLGSEVLPGSAPYAYPQLAVYAFPQEGRPATRTWPYEDLATAGVEHGIGRCLVLVGDQLTYARQQEGTDPWRSGAGVYSLTFRPMLPGESDCGALPLY